MTTAISRPAAVAAVEWFLGLEDGDFERSVIAMSGFEMAARWMSLEPEGMLAWVRQRQHESPEVDDMVGRDSCRDFLIHFSRLMAQEAGR